MKKLTFLIALVFMLIFGACTKDGLIPVQTNGDDNLLKHGHIPKVIKVLPVAGDNTQNLLDAFAQAKAAGPNSVVQLVEGVYNINFMEVYDFIGSFKGAGQGKTIIKPVPDLLCADWAFTKSADVILIKFVGGDIKMSDLSLKADDGFTCAPPAYFWMGRDLYGFVSFVDWVPSYTPKTRFVKAWIENVEFNGGKDDGTGLGIYNVGIGIWFGHDYNFTNLGIETRSSGNLTVRNCKFGKMMAALDAAGLGHGKITFTDNVCKNLYQALYMYDIINIDGSISNNRFSGSKVNDIYIDNFDMTYAWGSYSVFVTPTERTTYKITGNLFNPNSNAQSMLLVDNRRSMYPDENMPDRYLIHGNIIETADGSSGIVGKNFVDALIQENKFSGKGVAGITLDGDAVAGIYAYDDKLIMNRFSGADYSEADIILGANTNDCMVVGVSSDETVIDNGTGNTIKIAKHWKNIQHHGWYNFNQLHGNFPMHPNNK